MYRTEGGYVIEERRTRQGSRECFDRVRFAMRALDVLRPPGMSVLVREGRNALKVEQGRYWDKPPGSTWAVVSIPDDASRVQIALCLAELVGVAADPFVLDVLLGMADAH